MDSTIPYFSHGTYTLISPICFALLSGLKPVRVITVAFLIIAVYIALIILLELPELLIATTKSPSLTRNSIGFENIYSYP